MNILILGGLGFLGRNLIQKLNKNNKVFVVDCVESKNDNYYKLSLSDSESLIKVINEKKIDVLIHLVSQCIPSSSREEFFSEINEFYIPTIRLFEYCAENKIKVVYFSSGGAIYGNQKEIFSEYAKCEPISYYGLSKLNLENAILFLHNIKGLEYLIVRPSNPYGFGQNIYGKQGIIAVIMGKILKNEALQIWGDGTAVKDYIYIDDFIFYILNLMENDTLWNDIYNIGSGIGISINNVLESFKRNSISPSKIEYIAESRTDVKHIILDCTKIQELFTHKCLTMDEGIGLFWNKLMETSKIIPKEGTVPEPVLSICIPTYGRVEILKNTLESIYSQNVNLNLFEVCISDNSPTDETKKMLASVFANKENLVYKKSTCEGYYNSVEALKLGKGKFLKLHNNYSKFADGMLSKFIERVVTNERKKTVLFFSSKSIKANDKLISLNSFDSFLATISYFSTWSTSFGVWKTDFDNIINRCIELDKMFPHTSILFALYDKLEYVIDNTSYFENQDVGKKSGYNLPETFGKRYIGMCKVLVERGCISSATFDVVRLETLDFISDWYSMSKHDKNHCAFDFTDTEKWLLYYYTEDEIQGFYKMVKKHNASRAFRKVFYLPLLAVQKGRKLIDLIVHGGGYEECGEQTELAPHFTDILKDAA